MIPPEQYVCDLFRKRFGLALRKIDEQKGISGKRPDFEYLENNERIFVCELKEFVYIEPSEKAGWDVQRHPDGSAGGTRNCNAPNQISRKIYAAYEQLKEYTEPKILIFLSHYPSRDVRDLEETYKGYAEYAVGERIIIDKFAKCASDRISEVKAKIDLYIWIDAADKLVSLDHDKFDFIPVTEAGRKIVERYFQVSNSD